MKYNETRSLLTWELQHELRKNVYDFTKSERIADEYYKKKDFAAGQQTHPNEEKTNGEIGVGDGDSVNQRVGAVLDEDLIKIRPEEKKKVNKKYAEENCYMCFLGWGRRSYKPVIIGLLTPLMPTARSGM